MKLLDSNNSNRSLTFLELVWQRPYDISEIERILIQIANTKPRGPIIFEARMIEGRLRYFLGVTPNYLPSIKRIFTTLSKCYFYTPPEDFRTKVTKAQTLRLRGTNMALNTHFSEAVMAAAISALASVGKNETGVVQVVLGPSYIPTNVEQATSSKETNWLDNVLGTARKVQPATMRSMREKADQFTFAAEVRIGSTGHYAGIANNAVSSALCTLVSAGTRMYSTPISPDELNSIKIPTLLPWQMHLRLSVKEIVPLMLLPFGDHEISCAPNLHPKELLPPEWYHSPRKEYVSTNRIFAESVDGKQLSIHPKSSVQHTAILGPTGCGKSTIMLNLIEQDMKAGRGVLVIDPKADLVNDVLARVPEDRLQDVVVIDPADANPVGFNPLTIHKGQSPTLVTDSILAVFQELFKDVWGIRAQDILSASLMTLSQVKDANLMWIPSLLTDTSFRRQIVSKLPEDIALKPFWEQYDEMRDGERRAMIESSLNKFRQLLYRPALRNILGQSHPSFDLQDLFTKRKIVLVPLNKGLVGADTAKLLGSLIVGLTWTLALSRASIPAEKRHIVSMYIDELQDYLNLPTSFADALAQARSLGLGITVAHQYRGQLSPDIRQGIDANCRNKIIFGLNNPDAREMAGFTGELSEEDFMTLPRYSLYTNFLASGKQTGWIYGNANPPSQPLRLPAEAKAISQSIYGVPEAEVERNLRSILRREEREKKAEEKATKTVDLPLNKRKVVQDE